MFYKIGFWILLIALIVCGYLFMTTNPMKREGAMSWIDIYSNAPSETVAFLNEQFGITVTETTTDDFGQYDVIKAKGQMWPFAGVMKIPEPGMPASTMMYLTVKDYAATSEKIKAAGAIPQLENMIAGEMLFGVYEIPGGIVIGISQYENVPGDDN